MHIDRRTFMRQMIGITAALSLTSCSRRPTERPNILILLTDDQRFDTIHALGNKEITTPYMDALVKKGTSFTHAFIQGGLSAAVCMPSRAMIMTGKTAFHLKDNGRHIPVEHALMPETFRQAGYQTFATGKWHNGRKALVRGFDMADQIMLGGMADHYEIPLYSYDPQGLYPDSLRQLRHGTHSSQVYTDTAIRFLKDRAAEKPFFMFVSFQAPHDPRQVPRSIQNLYEPKQITLPRNYMPRHPFDNGELNVRDEELAAKPRVPAEVKQHIADYYGMLTHLDVQIGRILRTLDELNARENTVIVLAGDNGLALGQHGLMGKQNLYEHSVRVPLVFSGPGIPENQTRDQLVYLHDLYPTLCELCGLSVPETVQSSSFWPAIESNRAHRKGLVFVYKNFQRGLRTDSYKLIEYQVRTKKQSQLFDIKADPWEVDNLAEKPGYSDTLADLRQELQSRLTAIGDPVDLSQPDWGVPEIPAW